MKITTGLFFLSLPDIATGMTYYLSGRSGASLTENTLHNDDECGHLRNSEGGVRPVADSTVASLDDPDKCGSCCDVSDDGDDEPGTESNDETEESDGD